jgi:alginate O-acetyltransferase complex protein AlgI
MTIVMIGWVFFRADTLTGAIAFLKAMTGLATAEPALYTVRWYLTPELWLALAAGAIGSVPWVPAIAARWRESVRADLAGAAALAALLVLSIMQMAARTYNPFIYFRF